MPSYNIVSHTQSFIFGEKKFIVQFGEFPFGEEKGMLTDVQLGVVSPKELGIGNTGDADKKDYFVERDGMRFAGTHLLVDMWGASHLDEPDFIDATLREAALVAGATILHSHFHHFTPSGGVSGVVVLAESHISIHTWPERGFAAVDLFMCGLCDPYKSIPVLRRALTPKEVEVKEIRRGSKPPGGASP